MTTAKRTPAPCMRVALITTELRVGGAERCLTNLAERLDRRRFAPIVYCLAASPVASELVERLEAASVGVRFLGATSSWQFFPTLRKLRRLLRHQDPQIVQTFLFHANVVGGLAAMQATRAKVVLGFRVADPARWRMLVEKTITQRVAGAVCVSHSVANFVHRRSNLPLEKLWIIPNGIDTEPYRATQAADLTHLGIGADRQVILFVGRLDRQKGVDWLLSIAPKILRAAPAHEILIVGDGPLRNALPRLARARGIAQRVHFVGPRSDVPAIMRRSGMLVLPSRWEGMPNVVLEAMTSGLPVVATSAEGVEELLGQTASLQMVEIGDDTAFVDRVLDLVRSPQLAHSLGTANRERVVAHFTLQRMVEAYESLYDSLAGG